MRDALIVPQCLCLLIAIFAPMYLTSLRTAYIVHFIFSGLSLFFFLASYTEEDDEGNDETK